jgi:signal transduction histidine kinase
MKKIIGKWWAKAIAVILCIASVMMGAVSLGAMVYDAQTYDGELLNRAYDRIADNYSAMLLDSYAVALDEEDFLENAQETTDPQFKFAIIRSGTASRYYDVQKQAKLLDAYGAAEYLYGSAEDVKKARYYFLGGEDYTYQYSTVTLLEMLMHTGYSIADYEAISREAVYCVYYDAKAGLFYYETASGFYPVHSVMVTEDGQEKMYELTELTGTSETYFVADADDSAEEQETIIVNVETASDTDSSPKVSVSEAQEETAASETLVYLGENGERLGTLAPGSEVRLENNTGVVRVLTEEPKLAKEEPGGYIRYVDRMADITSEELVYGYEDTYIEDSLLVHMKPQENEYYYVFSYVDETAAAEGTTSFFSEAKMWVDRWDGFVPYAIPTEIVSVLAFFASLFFLMCAAGHRDGDGKICLRGPDTIWLEAVTLAAALAETGIVALMLMFPDEGALNVAGLLTIETELCVAFCFVLLLYLMTIAARIKAKQFWRYTILYWCWRGCRKAAKKTWGVLARFFSRVAAGHKARREFVRTHGSLVIRTVILLIIITIVLGFSLLLCTIYSYDAEFALFWFAAVMLIFWLVTLSVAMQMAKLQEGSRRIADGELSTPIDTKGLFWEFKVHAENINKVGDGITNAVEKQMKSERFKTELITNVSHDIKTPLTSIINYVDLMQKEDIENERAREYLQVLERQSARLKKLIEDLMEASKASTGNLAVNFETCDARVLLTQIVGEFEEKTAANRLEMIVSNPEGEVPVRVDSRHIWRVLDNLLGNICKYAQPETRVYISLVREGADAVITFKNISKYPLNISGEELMERFVRGDSSRNTEGSGLGLSIAQSLTALMNGTMAISVDGDLFKVILRFPVINAEKSV